MTKMGKLLLVGMLFSSLSYAVEAPAQESAANPETQVVAGGEERAVVREIARRRRHRRHRRHHRRAHHRRHRHHRRHA